MASLRKPNAGSFKPGHAGGPGRPRGSRSKLQELAWRETMHCSKRRARIVMIYSTTSSASPNARDFA
jgi:hypothetical protein